MAAATKLEIKTDAARRREQELAALRVGMADLEAEVEPAKARVRGRGWGSTTENLHVEDGFGMRIVS